MVVSMLALVFWHQTHFPKRFFYFVAIMCNEIKITLKQQQQLSLLLDKPGQNTYDHILIIAPTALNWYIIILETMFNFKWNSIFIQVNSNITTLYITECMWPDPLLPPGLNQLDLAACSSASLSCFGTRIIVLVGPIIFMLVYHVLYHPVHRARHTIYI